MDCAQLLDYFMVEVSQVMGNVSSGLPELTISLYLRISGIPTGRSKYL